MSNSDNESQSVTEYEDAAVSFGTALQEREFDRAVEFFDADAVESFLSAMPEEVAGFVSDDPELLLRRHRKALRALIGEIEGVTSIESASRNETAVVTIEFLGEYSSKQLQLHFDNPTTVRRLEISDEYSPPSYADRDTFTERAVTIESDGFELDGVLTLPESVPEPPVAVIVPGAGETDKHGEIGPNKYLQDIAWGLATDGIAVLRYDKRAVDHEIPIEEHDLDADTIDDAVRATEVAVELDGVDSETVIAIGHSQGGQSAPEIARRNDTLAGIALLDAPLREEPFEKDAEDFLAGLLEIDGMYPPQFDELCEQYRTAKEQFETGEYEADEELFMSPAPLAESQAAYDKRETVKEVDIPTFVLQTGQLSDQPKETYHKWCDAIPDERGYFVYDEALNHHFQRGDPPHSPLEPMLFHQNVDEAVIDHLVSWITEDIS